MRIQKGADRRRDHELHAGEEEDAVADAEKEDRDRHNLLEDFEFQEDVTAPQRRQDLQVDRVDGPEGEDDAGDPHVGDGREPFRAQQELDERCGDGGQDRHEREDHEGRELQRFAHRVAQTRNVVLQLGERREHHARQTAVDRVHRRLRELPSPIVESEIGRRIDAPDDESVEIDKECIQQGRTEQLPTEGEETVERVKGEHEARSPPDEKPAHRRSGKTAAQRPPHERPDAQPRISRSYSDKARRNRLHKSDAETQIEQEAARQNRILHAVDRIDDDGKRQHTQKRHENRTAVEIGNPGCGNIQNAVEDRRHRQTQVEDGIEIQIRRILLADKRRAEAAIHEDVRERNEYRQERQRPVGVRTQ